MRHQPIGIDDILSHVLKTHDGTRAATNWGERGIFYNPENLLPRGVYVLTIKERDGPNDRASEVDRAGVFRVNLGLSRPSFTRLFGPLPARPPAGGVVDTGHDFRQIDRLMPHPVYGWMAWACVLNPGPATFQAMEPLIAEAVELARGKYQKRLAAFDRQRA